LNKIISLKLDKFIDAIEEISTRASKEFGIKKELDKMYKEWKNLEFVFTILKNTNDVFIIKNFDECINLNDEHIGITTNL